MQEDKLSRVHYNDDDVLIAVLVSGRDCQRVNTDHASFVVMLECAVHGLESISHSKAVLLAHGARGNEILHNTQWNAVAWKMLVEKFPCLASAMVAHAASVDLC